MYMILERSLTINTDILCLPLFKRFLAHDKHFYIGLYQRLTNPSWLLGTARCEGYNSLFIANVQSNM